MSITFQETRMSVHSRMCKGMNANGFLRGTHHETRTSVHSRMCKGMNAKGFLRGTRHEYHIPRNQNVSPFKDV